MTRNIDNGQAASGPAQQAVQNASDWTSYYEDRTRAGGAGATIDTAGADPQPIGVSGPEVITGVQP